MPYVHRNAMGEIESLHRAATLDATEYLDASDGELQRFLNRGDHSDVFADLDGDFVRVLEDLIDVMVDKGMLRITDLPTAAQAKLFARKDQRAKAALRMESRFTASGFVELIDDSAFGKLSDTDLGTF